MSNWFSARKRGAVMGLWSTSNALGNIVGQQIAGLYFDVFSLRWEQCLFTYAAMMLASAALFASLITKKPDEGLLARDERCETIGSSERHRNSRSQERRSRDLVLEGVANPWVRFNQRHGVFGYLRLR